MKTAKPRIGIFRGTFDPLHAGHLSFAIKALDQATLDHLYFLVEQSPTHKSGASSLNKRRAKVARAVEPLRDIDLLTQPVGLHSIGKIIPQLTNQFGPSVFVFLMGSDVALSLSQWPDIKALCKGNELVIALRNNDKIGAITDIIDTLPQKPLKVTYLSTIVPELSSSAIRAA